MLSVLAKDGIIMKTFILFTTMMNISWFVFDLSFKHCVDWFALFGGLGGCWWIVDEFMREMDKHTKPHKE
jgi:hypothetical protein